MWFIYELIWVQVGYLCEALKIRSDKEKLPYAEDTEEVHVVS